MAAANSNNLQGGTFYRGKNVLVTGGCGLIGGFLTELLSRAGAKVKVVDNLSRPGAQLPRISACDFQQGDLTDYQTCIDACAKQEIVLNLAGSVTGIAYNQTHQAEMFSENMTLQQNVIRAAAAVGVKRFLQVSTACVYPHDAIVPTPESEGERDQPEPTNLGYGLAKRMGEQLAKLIAAESEMKVAIVRPFNAYGPGDNFNRARSHVIPALIERLLSGQDPLIVYGSGTQTRSFVHARDIAKGMLLITEKYPVADAVNIGHQEEISIRGLVELLLELTGCSPVVIFDTSKDDGYSRRAPDLEKLRRATGGWLPGISLREGLIELLAWYQGGLEQPAAEVSVARSTAGAYTF